MPIPNRIPALLAGLIAAAVPQPALATDEGSGPIGNAIQIVREVTGEVEARLRYLLIRDPVYRDEVIETQPESASRIIFDDGTELAVGPGARVTLDEFVFDPDPSIARFVLSAFEGVFRFKSGRLAKTAYAIETPNAVIGVRGTTFATAFAPDGRSAIILEAGDGVTVTVAGGCQLAAAPALLDQVDMAVIVDGCTVSRPVPPPAWAQEQVIALNVLLRELARQLEQLDDEQIEPKLPPEVQEAAIAPTPAAPPPKPPAEPPAVVPDDPPAAAPSSRGNSTPGNDHSGNGHGGGDFTGNGNGGNSFAGNDHSGNGGGSANNAGTGQAGSSGNAGGNGKGNSGGNSKGNAGGEGKG